MPDPEIDQRPAAEVLRARLAAADHATWNPRVTTTALGDRTFARVVLGPSGEAFLFLSAAGRWRVSDGMPPLWRYALEELLADDLDRSKVENGFQVRKRRAASR